MNVNLAARYCRFPEMQEYRRQLEAIGLRVPARWVNGEHQHIDGIAGHEMNQRFAFDDVEDFLASDIFIGFTEDPDAEAKGRSRGGRHVEFGMALMRHRVERQLGQTPVEIHVVGWRENVFHHLPEVHYWETWQECLLNVASVHGDLDRCSACLGHRSLYGRECSVCNGYGVVLEGVPG